MGFPLDIGNTNPHPLTSKFANVIAPSTIIISGFKQHTTHNYVQISITQQPYTISQKSSKDRIITSLLCMENCMPRRFSCTYSCCHCYRCSFFLNEEWSLPVAKNLELLAAFCTCMCSLWELCV